MANNLQELAHNLQCFKTYVIICNFQKLRKNIKVDKCCTKSAINPKKKWFYFFKELLWVFCMSWNAEKQCFVSEDWCPGAALRNTNFKKLEYFISEWCAFDKAKNIKTAIILYFYGYISLSIYIYISTDYLAIRWWTPFTFLRQFYWYSSS